MPKPPCIACPFRDGYNEEATQAQNWGCLPTKEEMLRQVDEDGTALSCHNDTKPCRGLAEHRDVSELPVRTYSSWYRD